MPNGEKLLDQGVPHDLAMEVIRYARERDLHVQAYRDDQLLIERDRPEAHIYSEHAGMPLHLVPDLDAAMGPTTPKLVIVAAPATLERLLPEVRAHWIGRLNAATSLNPQAKQPMKAKRRTGYGVFDISRQIARRVQREWEMVESPPRLPMSLTAELIPLP